MNKSSNITNNSFVDTSSNNSNKPASAKNVTECNPTNNHVNKDNNTPPVKDTPINMRNVHATDPYKSFVDDLLNFMQGMESGKTCHTETKTTTKPGGFEEQVTYTYSYDSSKDNPQDAPKMFENVFFVNNADVFANLFNNFTLPNSFNQPIYDYEKIQSAFSALSINEEEFRKLSKEQQEKQIQKKYHEIARHSHPDKNKDDETATAKFQELTEHKTVLLDYIKS